MRAAASPPATPARRTPVPLSIASYAWTASPASIIVSGAATAAGHGESRRQRNADVDAHRLGRQHVDVETVDAAARVRRAAPPPRSPAPAPRACPAALSVGAVGAERHASPFRRRASATNAISTLTITLSNANGFALIQSSIGVTLPGESADCEHDRARNDLYRRPGCR